MREDVPSLTAVYVTYMRALATHHRELSKACSDPYAERLLPRVFKPLIQRAASSPLLAELARRTSLGMCDHIALRTALIDAAIEHAVAAPSAHAEAGTATHASGSQERIAQVVLLGAGLDARAHRMPALSHAVVFEVDHPATQKLKQRKARALPVLAREVRYAPCDFQRTRIEQALARVGFDPSQRSVWVWEGVTMYLPATGVVDSLQTIEKLGPRESMLIATYVTPERVHGGALLGRWSSSLLSALAEPIRFTRTPDELAELVSHAGFEVLSDAAPQDAAPHFGVHVMRPTSLMPTERIVVAIKRGTQT